MFVPMTREKKSYVFLGGEVGAGRMVLACNVVAFLK